MCAADAQARELVERAVENQPRQEVGRLERIADDVAEIAAAAQTTLLDDVVGAAGMHEDRRAELRCLGPEGVVLRVGEVLAVDVTADGDAASPRRLSASSSCCGGEIGMLQRDRRHRRRSDRATSLTHFASPSFCASTIRRASSRSCGVPPPEAVDRQRLDIDALLVHHGDALRADDLVAACVALLLQRRALHGFRHFGNGAVAVHVDDADALAADRHLPARGGACCARANPSPKM